MCGGILAALFHRERTGEGQRVDCSLYSCGIWAAAFDIQPTLLSGEDATRMSRKNTGNPLYNTYQAKDGKWFQFVMLQTDRWWADVCKAIGREDLISDARFDTHEKRCQNNAEAIAILDQVLATKTREEWAPLFDEHQLVWAPHSLITDIISDPQALVNNYFPLAEHPSGQKMRVVGSPFQLSKAPLEIRSSAPALGQHTEEVLLELGYGWEQIQELKDERVVI
jgi:crotonobetainyl-CoA:carnitine CoA-transferase CaiB-like acyl-CoA transferase